MVNYIILKIYYSESRNILTEKLRLEELLNRITGELLIWTKIEQV